MLAAILLAAVVGFTALAVPAPQVDNTPLPPDHPIWFGRPLYFNYSLQTCMQAEGAWSGARVFVTNKCVESPPHATWDVGPYFGQIKLNKTDLCLDAGNYGSRTNGVKLTVQTCTNDKNRAQNWWYPSHPENPWRRIELAGGGCVERTNMCVDVTDGNKVNGRLQLWECAKGNFNQVWDLGRWCAHC